MCVGVFDRGLGKFYVLWKWYINLYGNLWFLFFVLEEISYSRVGICWRVGVMCIRREGLLEVKGKRYCYFGNNKYLYWRLKV